MIGEYIAVSRGIRFAVVGLVFRAHGIPPLEKAHGVIPTPLYLGRIVEVIILGIAAAIYGAGFRLGRLTVTINHTHHTLADNLPNLLSLRIGRLALFKAGLGAPLKIIPPRFMVEMVLIFKPGQAFFDQPPADIKGFSFHLLDGALGI